MYSVLFAGASLGGWFVIGTRRDRPTPRSTRSRCSSARLGLAMLYRLMDERGRVDIARDQAVWLLIGLACFALTLVIVRDIRQLDAYTYTIGLAGIVLLLLPIVPGIGYSINGARLWVNFGFLQFQPAEFGRVLIVIFLRVLPLPTARAARRRCGAIRASAGEGPRPAAARVGDVARGPPARARRRRVAAPVRRLRRDDVGRDRPVLVPAARDRPVRGRGVHRVAGPAAYPGTRRDLVPRARPGERERDRLSARPGMVRVRLGRHGPGRDSVSGRRRSSRTSEATSSSRHSARSWGCSASPRSCCCTSS